MFSFKKFTRLWRRSNPFSSKIDKKLKENLKIQITKIQITNIVLPLYIVGSGGLLQLGGLVPVL